jgi:DNA-binding FadR family transcriptional regulator
VSVPILSPDQVDFVEAVARRVVELLDERERPAPGRLVDATEIAMMLGVSRSTVYEHADELGAVRLRTGPRAPVRFDPQRALAAWTARESSGESLPADPPPAQRSAAPARRRRRGAARSSDELLPIRGEA